MVRRSRLSPNADNRTALEAAAAHSDPKSRAFAVSNLHEAEVSQVDTALMLTAAFTDREPAVRVAAATEASHYFGAGPDILAGLFALLTDSEGDVRGAARHSLDTLETPSDASRDFLLDEVGEGSEEESAMALRLLVRLEPNEPALDDLVPNLLADPRPRVALAAAVATTPPSDAAVASMRRVLRAELPALSGDERYAFRNDVLAELRKHGSASKAAVPEIVALVEAHSSEAAAFETLALIGEAEAPAMERALEFLKSTALSVRRNYALKMLKVVGPHGEEYLDEVIDVLRTHRMSDWRLTAAIMLGNLGPRAADAADALLEAAENDAKERVRRACMDALLKIVPNDPRVARLRKLEK